MKGLGTTMRYRKLRIVGWLAVVSLLGASLVAPAAVSAGLDAPSTGASSTTNATVACGTGPLDVELIIDRSGSMGNGATTGTRMNYARLAADGLVDSLQANGGVGSLHHVGLSSFGNGSATTNLALGTSNATTVKNAINLLTGSGDTPLRQGMAVGAADMTAHKESTRNGLPVTHVIIILSDGSPNPNSTPPPDNFQHDRPTAQNITDFRASADVVYSIAVGSGGTGTSGVDIALMTSLAKPTPDNFRHVTSNADLGTLFQNIFTEIACPAPGIQVTKGVSLTNGSGYGPSVTTTAGTTVYYRVHVSNTGNVALTGVTLSDSLAPDLGGCTIPTTLAAGADFTCDYSGAAVVGTTTNTATADSNETPSAAASATVTVDAAPGIQVTKGVSLTNGSGYGPSVTTTAGTTVYYRVHVSNTGNVALTGVTLSDSLAPDLGGCTIPTTLAAGADFTCDYSGAAVVGTTTNTATADSNETSPVSASATVIGQTAILNLTKEVKVNDGAYDSGSAANPGDTLTYRLTITNTGSANATGETVTDNLSAVLAHATWNDDASASSGSTAFSTPTLTWSGVSIAANGGTATLSFSVTLDATGWTAGSADLANTAVETNSQNCPSTQAAGAGCSTLTTVTTGTDLSFTKAVDPSTIHGGASAAVTYTLVVANNGTGSTAGHVLVTDNDFPAFYSITGVVCSPTSATCDAAHLTGSGIDLGSLAAGATVTVTVTGTATPNNTTDVGTPRTNTANACEQVVGAQVICVHAPATLNVTLAHLPAINVVKTASATALPYPGGDVTYTYEVTNTGNVPLSNVTLTDDKCSNVTFTGGDANTNQLLDLSETWTFQCTSAITVTTVNVATATGHDAETTVQATDQANVAVGAQLLITKTITSGSAPVLEGDSIAYSLSYALSNGPVTNGIITDVLPDGLTYTAGTATNSDEFTFGGYDAGTRTLTWIAATVTKDGSVAYAVTAAVGSADLDQPLTNVATITSDQTAPASNSASISVGKVEDITSPPSITPPPTSTLDQGPASQTGNGLLVLLVAITGFMLVAGVLIPTPERARRRNRRG